MNHDHDLTTVYTYRLSLNNTNLASEHADHPWMQWRS